MPGIFMFTGDSLSESVIKITFENYRNEVTFEYDGESGLLIDEIHDFKVQKNGSICLVYSYDMRIPYEYQGQTKHRTQTFNVNVKIILGTSVFYLIENVRGSKASITAQKFSQLLYHNPKNIDALSLEPKLISEVENEDYCYLHGEGLKNLTSKDSTMLLYGALAIRKEDGSEEFSDTHLIYSTQDKRYTQFESLSTGFTVYLSSKKSSLTLKGSGANMDDLEKYFRSFILPKLLN